MAQYHYGNLVNQNDTTGVIPTTPDRITVVSIQTDHTNPANAVIALQGTYQGLDPKSPAPIFMTLAATDPTSVTGQTVNSFTGPDKAGVVQFNASGCTAVQAIRTDANGTAAGVTITVVQS